MSKPKKVFYSIIGTPAPDLYILHQSNLTKKKAYTEGSEEGRAEGREEAILETARNLKALGASTDMIARATGLSKAEIEAL